VELPRASACHHGGCQTDRVQYCLADYRPTNKAHDTCSRNRRHKPTPFVEWLLVLDRDVKFIFSLLNSNFGTGAAGPLRRQFISHGVVSLSRGHNVIKHGRINLERAGWGAAVAGEREGTRH